MHLVRCDRCNNECTPSEVYIVKIGTDYDYRQTNFGVKEYDLCKECKSLIERSIEKGGKDAL